MRRPVVLYLGGAAVLAALAEVDASFSAEELQVVERYLRGAMDAVRHRVGDPRLVCRQGPPDFESGLAT